MSSKIVCDRCGEPIDQTQPYYTGTGQEVQVQAGTLVVVGTQVGFDFHLEHVPWTPDVPVDPTPPSG